MPDGWEPDDTVVQASLLVSDGSLQQHRFHHSQDEDWARFSAQAGVSYLVETSLLGYAADTYLTLLGPDGQTELAENDDCQGQPRSCIRWTADSSHTTYVRVHSAAPMVAGCKEHDYFLSVRALSYDAYLPLLTRSAAATAGQRSPGQAAYVPAAVGNPAHSLLVHPHKGWLYTASEGTAADGGLLTISDPASSALLARVAIGGQPQGMALDPVAGRLYVTSWEQGSVTVFDAQSGEPLAEAADLQRPSGLALVRGAGQAPGQAALYVAETSADRLVILDGKTAERQGEIKVGADPYALAASADGERVYVALAGNGEVAVLDTRRQEVMARAPLGGLGVPQDVAVHDSSGHVYVLYLLAPRYCNVAILDANSGQQVGLIAATLDHPLDGAQALAVDGARDRLYVSDSSGLQVFSTATAEWLATLPAEGPANPFGLAVESRRGQVYAALLGDQSRLSVFP